MSALRHFILPLLLAILAMPAGAVEPTSHDADIDRVRMAIKTVPTTAETYRKRSVLMFLWLASLQQQGADTHPFFDIDKKYYRLENAVLSQQGTARGRGAARDGPDHR